MLIIQSVSSSMLLIGCSWSIQQDLECQGLPIEAFAKLMKSFLRIARSRQFKRQGMGLFREHNVHKARNISSMSRIKSAGKRRDYVVGIKSAGEETGQHCGD